MTAFGYKADINDAVLKTSANDPKRTLYNVVQNRNVKKKLLNYKVALLTFNSSFPSQPPNRVVRIMFRYISNFSLISLFSLFSYQSSAEESLSIVTDTLKVSDSGLVVLELSDELVDPANLFDLSNKTLRATPNGYGYSLEIISSQFVENQGEPAGIGQSIPINNFQFEFSNILWDSFFINPNPT